MRSPTACGRRPIYLAGSLIGAAAAFPFFGALQTQSLWLIMLAGIVIINISHDLNDAVESSFFSELFGTKVRYTGAAMGHQFGAVLGDFSPLIAGGLSAAYGNSWVPVALYVTVACLIRPGACTRAARRTRAALTESEPRERRFQRQPELEGVRAPFKSAPSEFAGAGPCHVARLRQLVDELDLARALVGGQALAREGDQVVRLGRRPAARPRTP